MRTRSSSRSRTKKVAPQNSEPAPTVQPTQDSSDPMASPKASKRPSRLPRAKNRLSGEPLPTNETVKSPVNINQFHQCEEDNFIVPHPSARSPKKVGSPVKTNNELIADEEDVAPRPSGTGATSALANFNNAARGDGPKNPPLYKKSKDIFAQFRESAKKLNFTSGGGGADATTTATETDVEIETTSAFSETTEVDLGPASAFTQADDDDEHTINLVSEIKELAQVLSGEKKEEPANQQLEIEKTPAPADPQPATAELQEKKTSETTEAPLPPRPAYKKRLTAFLRTKLGLKKNCNEVITNEDAGLSGSQQDPIGFKFSFTDQTVVNDPIKSRLARLSDLLGLNYAFSMVLHCGIFFLSFWLVNFFMTFYFPTSEDEKVSFIYGYLTQADVNTLSHHVKHYQHWLVRPKFHPELAAIMLTIIFSSLIAKVFRKPGRKESTGRIPLIKLC